MRFVCGVLMCSAYLFAVGQCMAAVASSGSIMMFGEYEDGEKYELKLDLNKKWKLEKYLTAIDLIKIIKSTKESILDQVFYMVERSGGEKSYENLQKHLVESGHLQDDEALVAFFKRLLEEKQGKEISMFDFGKEKFDEVIRALVNGKFPSSHDFSTLIPIYKYEIKTEGTDVVIDMHVNGDIWAIYKVKNKDGSEILIEGDSTNKVRLVVGVRYGVVFFKSMYPISSGDIIDPWEGLEELEE